MIPAGAVILMGDRLEMKDGATIRKLKVESISVLGDKEECLEIDLKDEAGGSVKLRRLSH